MADGWIENRGVVLRADGAALTVTRGQAAVMPLHEAMRALGGPGFALWLAGLTWRPPRGLPSLRRLRMIEGGLGTWGEARVAFLDRWLTMQPAPGPRVRRRVAAKHADAAAAVARSTIPNSDCAVQLAAPAAERGPRSPPLTAEP